MKNEILNILKNKSEHISGEKISKELNISRTTVWNYINALKKDGYEIESVTNKGYKILSNPDLLNYSEIQEFLSTEYIGREFVYLESVDSTNRIAKELAFEKKEGLVIISEEQLGGKGRMGRNWISPKYKGIWMTILIKPDIDPSEASKITLIASAAIHKAMDKMGIYTQIKWPNDILINRKKICGVLTEMNCELDLVNYMIVGIGINANLDRKDFSEDLKEKASSIKMEIGKEVNRKELVGNILNEFEKLYEAYKNNGHIKESIEINRQNLVFLNEKIKIIKRDSEEIVLAKDLDDNGMLIVEHEDESIEKIFSGEISIRGLNGYI